MPEKNNINEIMSWEEACQWYVEQIYLEQQEKGDENEIQE